MRGLEVRGLEAMRRIGTAVFALVLMCTAVAGCGKNRHGAQSAPSSGASVVTSAPVSAQPVAVSGTAGAVPATGSAGQPASGGSAGASKRATDLSAVTKDLNDVDAGTKQADTDLGAGDSASKQPDN